MAFVTGILKPEKVTSHRTVTASQHEYAEGPNVLIVKSFCFLSLFIHFSPWSLMEQWVRISVLKGFSDRKVHYRTHKSRLLDNTLNRMDFLFRRGS
jgi:hypothetical protein